MINLKAIGLIFSLEKRFDQKFFCIFEDCRAHHQARIQMYTPSF